MSLERATTVAIELMKLGVSQAGVAELLGRNSLEVIEAQLSFLPYRKRVVPKPSSSKPSATTLALLKNSMPRLTLKLPPPETPWTKVPNILTDRLMPTLKDTELRLLLVLIRQTAGWGLPNRPVTMTYRSLMKRTGRGSEAIASAIQSLRASGLIHSRTSIPHAKGAKARRFASKIEGQQYTEKN